MLMKGTSVPLCTGYGKASFSMLNQSLAAVLLWQDKKETFSFMLDWQGSQAGNEQPGVHTPYAKVLQHPVKDTDKLRL